MEPFLTVVDRYGLPLAMLAVMAYAVYKLIWPVLIRQIDESRAQMKDQLKDSNDRFDKASDEFLKALQRRDEMLAHSFKELHARLDRDRDAAKAEKKLKRPSL